MSSTASVPPQVIAISRSGSKRWPVRACDVVGDRGAQVVVAGERQPRVRRRVVERRARHLDGLGRQRQVGVEVLQPQHRAVARRVVGGRGDLVDAEADDVVQALRAGNGLGLDRGAMFIFSVIGVRMSSVPAASRRALRRDARPSRRSARSRRGRARPARLRPDARAARVQVQVLDDAERVRLRAPDRPRREADRVQLAGQPGALEALEQLCVERRAVHRGALAGAQDPYLGRRRLGGQQVRERDAERVGQRVERLDRRIARAGLELRERAPCHARAARELEGGRPARVRRSRTAAPASSEGVGIDCAS